MNSIANRTSADSIYASGRTSDSNAAPDHGWLRCTWLSTSRLAPGFVVPIPILPLTAAIWELPMRRGSVSHSAIGCSHKNG